MKFIFLKNEYCPNRQLPTAEISTEQIPNRSLAKNDLKIDVLLENRQLLADDLIQINLEWFLSIGFTHHCELLTKTGSIEERLFYIEHCATEFWSVEIPTTETNLKTPKYVIYRYSKQ